jgi:cytochrome c oxidase assembly factor CtaG
MVQHLLLVLVAAPLLVLGAPERVLLWAFSARARRRVAHWFSRLARLARGLAGPGPGVALATAALWSWHVPALYDAAVADSWVHSLEHSTFLGGALLFWWTLLQIRTRRGDALNGGRLLALFAMVLQGSLLGALLTFASAPLYSAHAVIPAAWTLTPLADQQLAGLIMWVPPAALYLGVAAYLVLGWLGAAEHGGRSAEARAVAAKAAATGTPPRHA